MTAYRYWILECDACHAVMGRSSDQSHPARGIAICADCWSKPESLPRHLQSTITFDQAARELGRREATEIPKNAPATIWSEGWDEETWEEALLHHGIITDLIYARMTQGQTSTATIPAWVLNAAQDIVRYYMCRRCGYGLVDLGVTARKCNDCAPLLAQEPK